MSDTTSTIYDFLSPSGVIVPDTSTLLTDVQTEWTDSFGTGLNLDSSKPQGVMISAEVSARVGVAQNNAAVANQINPNEAEGMFLDAIASMTGLTRAADTFTIVPGVILAGELGSPVAANTVISSPAGDLFNLQTAVTLDPTSGQAVGTYVAQVAGPIPAPAGAWTIQTQVLGLETVNNPTTATPGTAEQTDNSLRTLRTATLAGQTVGIMEASLGALSKLPGVIGRQGLENVGAAQTIDGVAMKANSVWFVVDGGSPADIANALLRTKGSGSDWNGAQSVPVVEPASGQTYTVNYDVPTDIPLLVRVTCKQQNFVGNINSSVVQAVLDFATNALDGIQGWIVGENASPFEVAAAVMSECPGLYVSKVELTLASAVNYQPAEIAMAIFQKATVISGNIAVVTS